MEYPASDIKSFPIAVWINENCALKVEEGFSIEPDPRDKLKK